LPNFLNETVYKKIMVVKFITKLYLLLKSP
jgi:hypothetical protein